MDDMHYQKTSKARLVEMHKAQVENITAMRKIARKLADKNIVLSDNNKFLREELDKHRELLDEANEYINELLSGNP